MIDDLKTFQEELKELRRDLKRETVSQIAKKSLRERAEKLATTWLNELRPKMGGYSIFSDELLEKYSIGCRLLLKLSAPNNLKTRYLKTVDSLIKPIRAELIIPLQSGEHITQKNAALDGFFATITNPEENDYLAEAIACAKAEYFRAAVVLGWGAAIDRIHRKIEETGFSKFNVSSATIASQTKGRFKKFNQTQNVTNISELRMVFDTTILWVLEGMGWIDSNQHTRLKSCFDMRCHGAHPGDAPITEYNLMSFFSDLDQIVLSNPKFSITSTEA